MNKNFSLKAVLAGLVLTVASSAFAQSALQQLGQEAGVEAAPLAQQFKAARALDVAPEPVVGIPLHAKDVLSTCSALEAKPFMAWNLSQAVVMVQTCLNHAYAQDGYYTVFAAPARFAVRGCPGITGQAICNMMVEVQGIKITVKGNILTGDPVLMDMNETLSLRSGKLFGFYAILDDQSAILN